MTVRGSSLAAKRRKNTAHGVGVGTSGNGMKQAPKERKKALDSYSTAFRTIQNVSVQIQDFQTPTSVVSQHTAAKSKVKEGMK
jgi:hypothetical protein